MTRRTIKRNGFSPTRVPYSTRDHAIMIRKLLLRGNSVVTTRDEGKNERSVVVSGCSVGGLGPSHPHPHRPELL